MPDDVYPRFVKYIRELSTVHAVEALLDWDQETYMPPRAAAHRADQLELIAGIGHERLIADELGELLAKLEAEKSGDAVRATNIRETRRQVDRARKLPTALVKELTRAVVLSKEAWVAARKNSDFAAFAPHLQKILDLKREVAERVGWKSEPYDALMDEFEPGAKSAEIQQVFDGLKPELVALVEAIRSAPRQPKLDVLSRDCPVEGQRAFNDRILTAFGFDAGIGRLDVSAHPFCSGITPLDVRLTTRYDAKYVPMSLFGVMHECGHGLYESGFEVEHTGTPMAAAASLGIHESQSRLWENQVGRSRAFWSHFFKPLQEQFPALRDVALDDWYFAINNVRPSLIRVEADEVTYGLHIMLRFDLERRMFRGELAVKDVPAAWNAGMKSLLGVTPPSHAEGCLQDIHWSMGIFGYFPTYQLGNLYSAQFFSAARRDLTDLDGQIAAGSFSPLREWLREKIHRQGKRYLASELVRIVTGAELSPRPYLEYLKAKYRPLYGLT